MLNLAEKDKVVASDKHVFRYHLDKLKEAAGVFRRVRTVKTG